jgi:hypothetical protein
MATCKNQDLLTFLQGGHKSIKVPFEKNILHKLSKSLHNNTFNIEDRGGQVASMLAQSMTEMKYVLNLMSASLH